MNKGVCEVCGADFLVMVQDVLEVEPIADDNGRLWERWVADGEVHYFCEEHNRLPIRTRLNNKE